jgi:DNA modification methylase
MSDGRDSSSGNRRERRATSTSAFGSSRREGHDSSAFYARFGTPLISSDDDVAHGAQVDAIRDRIFVGDSRSMHDIPDRSVGLIVTSPPYFAGKAYEEALGEGHIPADYVDYLQMLRDVLRECRRVLEPGGRIVVNVANLGRKPFRSLASDVTAILQDDLEMLLRGEIVWLKQRGSSGSCAWGSFRSASNPVLRDTTERLIVASKGRFDRAMAPKERERRGLANVSTITADEFMEATLDVWEIAPESASRVNHPAPFPVALVERCIDLYSFANDVVLDPFMGSGTTAVAARLTGRSFVGYEMDPDYVDIAHRRLDTEAAPDVLTARSSNRDVRTMRDIVAEALDAAGCVDVEWGVRIVTGVEISGRARTPRGQVFLFDLVGGSMPGRTGLSRGDLMWREIGRAAVVGETFSDTPFVIFSAGLPERTGGAPALDVVVGPGRPITGVIHVVDTESTVVNLRHQLDAMFDVK